MHSTKELLTVQEAFELTKRKPSTWRADILRRRIPFVRLGRSVRIPREFVETMIRDGWREPVPAAGARDDR